MFRVIFCYVLFFVTCYFLLRVIFVTYYFLLRVIFCYVLFFVTILRLMSLDATVFTCIQWNLSKADTIGAKKFVRFRQMSAL